MNIYLDVNGVLLKKDGTLADGFEQFINFFVEKHNVFWLTTHCRAGENKAIEVITIKNSPSDKTLELLKRIKDTDWQILKTEVIDFFQPFVWFDDNLMEAERRVLLENNSLSSFHRIDLVSNPKILNQLTKFSYSKVT